MERVVDLLVGHPPFDRSRMAELYGPPLETEPHDGGRLVSDAYGIGEGLVLRVARTARDPEDRFSVQQVDLRVEGETSPDPAWRFAWPSAPVNWESRARKVARLNAAWRRILARTPAIERAESFADGEVQRTFRVMEPFDYPVGRETWTRDGVVVAQGVYRNGERWSGSFLEHVSSSTRPSFRFRKVVMDRGALQHSFIPEWEVYRKMPWRPYPSQARGSATEAAVDAAAYRQHQALLDLLEEPAFLEWTRAEGLREAYRVLVRPTFSPALLFKVVLRSERGPPFLEWAMTDGGAGFPDSLTQVVHRSRRPLARSEVRELRRIVARSLFWSDRREWSPLALDGWSLSYEGLRAGRYAFRRHDNPDAASAEALASWLLNNVPWSDHLPPGLDLRDPYLSEVRDLVLNAVAILETAGRREQVDELLHRPAADTLARAFREAARLRAKEGMQPYRFAAFDTLAWDATGDVLITPDGDPVHVSGHLVPPCFWTAARSFRISLTRPETSGHTAVATIELTPAATVAALRAEGAPPPSPMAMTLLEELGLNPENAAVSGEPDAVETLIVAPPPSLPGARSYLITLRHAERAYRVSYQGGFWGMGGGYQRPFPDDG